MYIPRKTPQKIDKQYLAEKLEVFVFRKLVNTCHDLDIQQISINILVGGHVHYACP